MEEILSWFEDHGLGREDTGATGYIRYGIAWSNRSGHDFTDLYFQNDPKSNRPEDWEAVVGHHQSGENPRMHIGTCRNLAEIGQVFEAIRITNGYNEPEPIRSARP